MWGSPALTIQKGSAKICKMEKKIKILKNGPYRVMGNVPLEEETIIYGNERFPIRWEKGKKFPERENYLLCRCGKTKNPPYCDDTHTQIGFDGSETARRDKYLKRAKRYKGPDLELTDDIKLCARAHFCLAAGDIWNLTERSDDPESRALAIQQAFDCSAGRLVVWDKKTGKPIEPKFEPSISVTEDPHLNVSGPLWVKGGIPIESADGEVYEVRNRVTLCRCGKSSNKPFCDGTHLFSGFRTERTGARNGGTT